ncbi:hypothetical protein P153DRAFT_360873 [Dothidotthia symphoricarpi CBS 119687]|uniref:Membrane-associated protein n=1 Tax=Dothidotthia symphoricarpi CBS 119687 TaxID=1392245 RepID=A0A6A6A277_9PLEO|nr:uncharacterized protein P153DRAFT_360873 [Dothidotthia symphoricarpi CBS 119687]KAF2124681.1 hypothetical protein P153DRAFT_360873 [Dothidotthia symphoricarpi CBS 119687]
MAASPSSALLCCLVGCLCAWLWCHDMQSTKTPRWLPFPAAKSNTSAVWAEQSTVEGYLHHNGNGWLSCLISHQSQPASLGAQLSPRTHYDGGDDDLRTLTNFRHAMMLSAITALIACLHVHRRLDTRVDASVDTAHVKAASRRRQSRGRFLVGHLDRPATSQGLDEADEAELSLRQASRARRSDAWT